MMQLGTMPDNAKLTKGLHCPYSALTRYVRINAQHVPFTYSKLSVVTFAGFDGDITSRLHLQSGFCNKFGSMCIFAAARCKVRCMAGTADAVLLRGGTS